MEALRATAPAVRLPQVRAKLAHPRPEPPARATAVLAEAQGVRPAVVRPSQGAPLEARVLLQARALLQALALRPAAMRRAA